MVPRIGCVTARVSRGAKAALWPKISNIRSYSTGTLENEFSNSESASRTRRSITIEKPQVSAEPMYKELDKVGDVYEPFCHNHLPHPLAWKSAFSFTRQQSARHRYFVARRETVQEIVSKIGLDDPERKGQKVTVIEAYAGPGTITRELMKHPSVERVVALEQAPCFLPSLEELKKDPTMEGFHEKLRILPDSGFVWDSYDNMVDLGYLSNLENKIPRLGPNAPPMDWEAPSPIVFVAQIPNTVHGEQLFAQLIHAIPSGFWLFKFGRVKMVFVCGETVAIRALATPAQTKDRAKLGATVQCLSTPELLFSAEQLQPYADYFYPSIPSIGPRVPITNTFIPNANISSGLSKRNLSVLSIDPLKHALVSSRDMDSFEFLARNLFVLRTKPIAEALKHVAPGAANVLKMLAPTHPRMQSRPEQVILPETPVVALTNEQLAALAAVFEKWPFRPENLFEDGRMIRNSKTDKQFF
ncbi:hypothetical protein MYAM1_001151 [Malassezia yamatoensis]|uniref:rRNA adenine N(6)-methyltransferase n=1 Tax=Malassezia yamatoensis TaxID=253288 RepID=A0AAJ5YXT4_9BASI|nr:hypothetical protein MYAM1_001151 [Malassezia yamatoensis]